MQTRLAASTLFVLCASPIARADLFSAQQLISAQADGARSVHVADLDGDGDPDVLSASSSDDKVAWYENLGGAQFGAQQVITTDADKAGCVHAADLDGDGDLDVLSTSIGDDKLAWYENLGAGQFGPEQLLDTTPRDPRSVIAADLDGDGDADVLSASSAGAGVTWYENLGAGAFAASQAIDATLEQAYCVRAADLDGDGDADVLAAGLYPGTLTWYENLGGGQFGARQVIDSVQGAYGAYYLSVDDLDGDGHPDVLWKANNSSGGSIREVRWYENDGAGQFQSYDVYRGSEYNPVCMTAADLDGDGAREVVWGGGDSVLVRHHNTGSGGSSRFDDEQVISDTVTFPIDVCAADLDGDGDADLVAAANLDDTIVWFENQTIDPSTIAGFCFGDGTDGTSCPCSNDTSPGAQEGCRNSQGHGAVLEVVSGGPVYALDDLVLGVSQARPGQPAVLVQGSSQVALAFKDGKLCAGFPTERMEVLLLDAVGQAVTTQSIVTEGNVPGPGATRYYQAWYRDPAVSVCGSGSNLTGGLVVDWM